MNNSNRRSWGMISATLVALIALAMFAFAATAHAATLAVTSSSATVTPGDIVTVTIVVNSSDQAINTAEGTLNFPSNILQAESIDKSSSIFTIWIQDPSFSNSAGQVTFSGGLPTPGYQGTGGIVLSTTFVAKQAGTAALTLSDASVRANDGLGTDVLTGTGGLTINVTAPAAVVTQPTPITTSPVTTTPTSTTNTTSGTTPPTITSSSFTYDPATGMLAVTAKAHSAGSGIANYSVSIDSGTPVTISPATFAKGPYLVAVSVAGSHTAQLTVTDNDGNKTSVTNTFMVPAISSPTLNALPSMMDSGSQLLVQGTAGQDDAKIVVDVSKDGGAPIEFSATPDANGSFIVLGPIVQKGTYQVWAVGTSAGGIMSAPSVKMQIVVSDAVLFSFGPIGLTLADILIISLLFSLGSFIAAAIGWYKVYTYHRSHKKKAAK